MMGRTIMGALVAGAMGAAPAFADAFATSIVEQLEQQGFKSISRERTWLGRTRIVAESDDGQREIIVNPNNGEILRDLWLVERRNGEGGEREERRAGGESAAAPPSAGGQDGGAGGKPAATGDETGKGKEPTTGGDGGGEKPAPDADGDDSGKDDGKTEKPKEHGWDKDGKSWDHDWDKSGDEGDKTGGWDGKDTGDVKK